MVLTEPSLPLLAGCALLFLCLAFIAPPYVILASGIALSIFPFLEWQYGMQLDLRDVAFAALALAFLLRRARRRDATPRIIPYLGLWVTYGLLASLAYLNAPEGQTYLTSPGAVVYQLYRYCWRPTLYYPVTVLLAGGARPRDVLFMAVVIAAGFCGVEALLAGRSGVLAG